MILPNPEYKGLVRGYVVYGTRRAGYISMERALDPEYWDVGVAFTPYHRHDENPETIAHELEKLEFLYASFRDVGGMMVGYEYRPYKG